MASVVRVPCFHPLKAYRAPGGGVAFSVREGYVDLPLDLPCGQCIGCRVERSRQWALRCVHEASMHKANCFVTLTYSEDALPGDGGLHVEDWQKFAKRLRKRVGPFRFFHCGEYGETTGRPHYHACLFGIDFAADRIPLRSGGSGKHALYVSPLLTETWGHGHCSVGDLSFESAAYVARYVLKKLTGPEGEVEYSRVDVETGEYFRVRAPYVTMSRRPGLGAKWFEKYSAEVYPADEVVHAGRRFRPPRFYDGKLSEEDLDQVKAGRIRRAVARREDVTPDRLAVREECAAARLSRLRRSL